MPDPTRAAPEPAPALVRRLTELARALRDAGVPVGPGDLLLGLRAVEAVGLRRPDDVAAALRASWCRRREDQALFDRLFRRLLGPAAAVTRPAPATPTPVRRTVVPAPLGGAQPPPPDGRPPRPPRGVASVEERLRRLDFAACSPAELVELERAMARLRARPPLRPSRHRRPARRGRQIDWARTQRAALRTGGEWLRLEHSRPRPRRRPLLLVCDVSGSMERYARLLIRFLHAVERSTGGTEAFVFGTRLTRITRQLRSADPGVALAAVGEAVPDFAGGTRIGESLHRLLTRWGGRALGRGPITLVVSDGWEVGDRAQLAAAAARLQRASWRLLWCNPRMGDPRFTPAAGGMQAVLPYLDALRPAHNLESLEQLSDLLDTAQRRRPVRPQRPRAADVGALGGGDA